jgi:SAM-dependent methyltransferase
LSTALAFLAGPAAPDYGALLSRLRWRRAIAADRETELSGEESAAGAFAGSPLWVVVRDVGALPARCEGWMETRPGPGEAVLSARLVPELPSGVGAHTLRELETARWHASGVAGQAAAALTFRPDDFSPRAAETVDAFLARVASAAFEARAGAGIGAVALEDPSETVRPELLRRLPSGMRRLADVGCGAGATGAEAKRRAPGLAVTGIEKDLAAAGRARRRLDRVLVGDAATVLRELARAGESFDAFLLGDVLEHTGDPIAVLSAARAAAGPGASLVASVPNAGHLSLVRDLVLGRFDPVPAGLLDAGHLRWFTKPFLAEALDEAGWTVGAIDAVPNVLPPDAEAFLATLGPWPSLDRASLFAYQWIADARAGAV